MRISRRELSTLLAAAGFLVVLGWMALQEDGAEFAGNGAIEELIAGQRSGVMVESEGVVTKVLRDDLEGSRHQRFIVRLPSGNTVLISHNIDLAPRIETLLAGDSVVFRGQYEWNNKGGVVHWTHHDPSGDRPGGWIRHEGREYY